MIDRTQEDINQDRAIEALKQRVQQLEDKLAGVLSHQTTQDAQLGTHRQDLVMLSPLKDLIGYIEGIIAFFEHLKRGFK